MHIQHIKVIHNISSEIRFVESSGCREEVFERPLTQVTNIKAYLKEEIRNNEGIINNRGTVLKNKTITNSKN